MIGFFFKSSSSWNNQKWISKNFWVDRRHVNAKLPLVFCCCWLFSNLFSFLFSQPERKRRKVIQRRRRTTSPIILWFTTNSRGLGARAEHTKSRFSIHPKQENIFTSLRVSPSSPPAKLIPIVVDEAQKSRPFAPWTQKQHTIIRLCFPNTDQRVGRFWNQPKVMPNLWPLVLD